MREFLMPFIAVLIAGKAGAKWVLPSVPEPAKVLVSIPVLGPVSQGEAALYGVIAFGAPKVESMLRGWF